MLDIPSARPFIPNAPLANLLSRVSKPGDFPVRQLSLPSSPFMRRAVTGIGWPMSDISRGRLCRGSPGPSFSSGGPARLSELADGIRPVRGPELERLRDEVRKETEL